MARSWQSRYILKNFATIWEVKWYRARYYDPSLERFLGEDSLGYWAGDANFYRYVYGNPANFVDPSGNLAWLLIPLLASPEALAWAGLSGGIAYCILNDCSSSAPNYNYPPYGAFPTTDTGGGEVCTSDSQDKEKPKFDPKRDGTPIKHPKTGEKGWEQPDGDVYVPDRSKGNPHGGSAWKKWPNKRDWGKNRPREGTYDKNGKRLRG